MNKVVCCILTVLLAFLVSASFRYAYAEPTLELSRQEKIKRSFEKYLENFLLKSLIPESNVAPSVISHRESHDSVYEELHKRHPQLIPLFTLNKTHDLYSLYKLSNPPKVFLGYPEYLQPRYDGEEKQEGRKKAFEYSKLLNEKLKDFEWPENFSVVLSPKEANIFIFPVEKKTFIYVSVPSRLSIHSKSRGNYENLFLNINDTFYNATSFKLNDEGLSGEFFTTEERKILVSFCPIDMQKSDPEIKESVDLCLIKSQGLPGFSRIMPFQKAYYREWGAILNKFSACIFDEGTSSFTDIDFSSAFKKCLKEKDYINAGKLFE
ncbi:MAG: hypothetical protein IPH06_06325 [Alphaproteobacteria bacterium]|nr:hypothetical protein [Alphaproteobacteria bacterium]QQS57634.1 MAG: hypothetical protein IPN28_02090 [Alphaproteobacteria bacterium]